MIEEAVTWTARGIYVGIGFCAVITAAYLALSLYDRCKHG